MGTPQVDCVTLKVSDPWQRIRVQYGLTKKQYVALLMSQNHRCAICRRWIDYGTHVPRNTKVCVDHNHETGKTRALLCTNCNTGLGSFNDNPEVMEKAAIYIRFHAK